MWGQVQGRNSPAETTKKLCTVVSSKKKWIVMNLIWCQMKKCNPSSEQNDQLVHWWLLVQSDPIQLMDKFCGCGVFEKFRKLASHQL